MKNFAKISVISVIALMLCGCAGTLPFTKQTPDFGAVTSFSAIIKSGELEAAATAVKTDGAWEFTFTEPPSLCGIVLRLDESGVTGHLGSYSFSVSENDAYALYPEIIAQTIDKLNEIPAESISSADGILTLETDFNGDTTTVSADESGKLISLKCPGYKLSVNFTD